jgi:hypothetical protein
VSLAERLTFIAFGLILAGWLYWLTGKVMLTLTYAEQILGMGARLLSLAPGKTAPRTEADVDEQPRVWFQTLRRLADLRDRVLDAAAAILTAPAPEPDVDEDLVDDVELARWADDGGATWSEPVKASLTADRAPALDAHTEVESGVDEDQTPTEIFPPVPATEPVERVEIAGGLRLPPEGHEPPELLDVDSPPIVDEVDLQLVRFGLRTAEGHRP